MSSGNCLQHDRPTSARRAVFLVATLLASTSLVSTSTSVASAADAPVNFDTQIVPVLTRFGCNSGACHGAAAGRGGFRLSLYGSNPEFDHESIAYDLKGRRVNTAKPDRSLVLLKPTESLNHGGGERFDLASNPASLLREWVRQGAGRESDRSLTSLKVTPVSVTLRKTGEKVAFKATAEFSNGSSLDVTTWTVFKSEDDAAVEVLSSGVAIPVRRGRHIVTARFLDRVLACEILVPFNKEPVGPPADQVDNASFVDQLIDQRLKELHLPASPQVSDTVFLRRVTLDLTGRLPSSADVLATQEKLLDRKQMVDRLMKSEAFVDYWTHWLTQLLRVRTQPQDQTAARTFHAWIRTRIASNTPLDEIARQLLMADGDTHEVGPANFYRAAGNARAQAEYASEVLMGVRLRCANCHDHPLDRWSQDDYHGLSAIFAKVKRGRVISIGSGEVSHPRTGEAAIPRIPGSRFLDKKTDGRVAFAGWLTSPDNPFFARAFVNRIWKTVIGRGLVEPTDDLRATNPATHPELLTRLADDLAKHDFDLRHTLRLICTSRVYGRSSSALPGNADDDRFLSRGIERRLSSAVLADAIADVTGITEPFAEEPTGTRAVSLFATNVPSTSLDILGRCTGEGSCESGMESRPGLSTTLHLINGPFLNHRITDPKGRLRMLLASGESPSKIVDTFFLTALSRPPSEKEQQFLLTEFQNCRTATDSQDLAEDMLWSLLTSREFVTRR
jgi:hypothetical protein